MTSTTGKSRRYLPPGPKRASSVRAAWLPGLRWLLLAFLATALMAPGAAGSSRQNAKEGGGASPSEVAEKQGDLKSLRSQIETLRQQMTAAEGSRKDALDQLQDAERAISSTQRELHQLASEIGKLQARLKELETQSRELERGLNAQQAALEKLLYRQYLRGNPDPLRLFLNGDDANQLARDLYYLEAIGRARSQILLQVQTTLQRQQALADDARQQADALSAVEARQKEEHGKLLAQRQQRQAMLDKVADQIADQRREIGNLQRDERRLADLVDRLSKLIVSRAAEAREARREAQRRELARQGTLPDQPARGARTPAEGEATGADMAPETPVEQAPPPPVEGNLARLKGQLRLPTRGAVSNRFGAARQEGSTWKGLFILAGTGSEVRSIAGGRVVFAEWMRGFGNLLIVDHGSSYLSIYANNDSLLKQVGDEVRSGEAIATVGNSGGNPESGLYFELRHQGKPVDPLAWVNPK